MRTSEAGTMLQNRNYASLLRDRYEKDLLDYYTMGQLALIDVKTKAVKKIGRPVLITNVDASPDDMKAGTETKLTKNVDFAPEVSQAIRKRLLVTRPRDDHKFWVFSQCSG